MTMPAMGFDALEREMPRSSDSQLRHLAGKVDPQNSDRVNVVSPPGETSAAVRNSEQGLSELTQAGNALEFE